MAQAVTAEATGLTDRELAMQRWFSQLTFMQERGPAQWPEWHDSGEQFSLTSLRYQIAFAAYGCAAMAAQTPAYRELVERQLRDMSERLCDTRIWSYSAKYWKYGDDAPDPCKYENVMYTGHLIHVMGLYENMTGDQRFSTDGWDFLWIDGRKQHYTLDKAVRGLYEQSVVSPSGGICCEPGLVFIDCNNHSASGFVLHDLVHGTEYAKANTKWFDWMRANFRNCVPGTKAYFFAAYNQAKGVFAPAGDVGADGWALGFGYPWYPDTGFAREGWAYILKHADWRYPAEGLAYAKMNPMMGCCMGVPTQGVSNAFVPLMAVQAEGAKSERAAQILAWLEKDFGRTGDLDGDGHAESYYYAVSDAYRIPGTGLIATAMATDGDSWRKLHQESRKDILAAPTLAHVDYPNVYVRTAEARDGALRFTVLKGNPGFSGETELVCTQVAANAKVTRDGQPWDSVSVRPDGSTVIKTTLDAEHTFEVR
jgi:hypothetical protein